MPITVGHEVIGKVVKAGPKVSTCKVGDRVGVGAQVWACLKCDICKSDNENYCPHMIGNRYCPSHTSFMLTVPDTYGADYPDGTVSQGGFASHIRVHEYFAFPIPESIPDTLAAPMMCAGITTFSPLKRAGTGPGKKIAIAGM